MATPSFAPSAGKSSSPRIGLAYLASGLKSRGPPEGGCGMSEEIIYGVEESIATITLNRPERMNALTHELEAELHRIFDRADADRAVRVIILTGAGRAFCAGYDQSQPESGSRHTDPTGKSLADYIEFWQRTDAGRVEYWTHMWRLGKPVIAAVNGWAMGGGFWYQLAADITIASHA